MKPESNLMVSDASGDDRPSTSLGLRVQQWLQPSPVAPPRIDPDFVRLDPVRRSAEVLRYSSLRLEYWLCAGGLLREWLRRNLRLAAALTIPLLLFAPALTLLFKHGIAWSVQLAEIADNLAQIPSRISPGVLITAAGCLLLRRLLRH